MSKGQTTNDPVVWLVSATFEPRGSSQYTLRLAQHLPEFGIRPVIICESAKEIPARLRSRLLIREVPRLNQRIWGWRALRRLEAEAEIAPALVHSQRLGLEMTGERLADSLDVPHLLTVHNSLTKGGTRIATHEEPAAVIAVSPSVQRDLLAASLAHDSIVHLIPSGVDVPDIPRIPAVRSHEKIPVVGTACLLEKNKGVVYFLMAAELILSSGHDVEFVVAGRGPEEETLRLIAQRLDIANRVTFAPHVTSFTQVIETFDVFVLPSVEQGLGTIMLEAMALGKPVVATRVGGVSDFVADGEHALLVEKENHVTLADKIELLLDFPDKARKLSLSGQELVRRQFSTERMVSQTAELYREVLARVPTS